MKMEYCLINSAPAFPLLASHPLISPDPHTLSIFPALFLPITQCFVTTLLAWILPPEGIHNWSAGVVIVLSVSIICTQANTALSQENK